MLRVDKVHTLIRNETGLPVIRAGQNPESVLTPYIHYERVFDTRYRRHQVIKKMFEEAGSLKTQYKNPVRSTFQYRTINDSSEIEEAEQLLTDLYNFMLTDGFHIGCKALQIGCNVLGEITEISLNKEDFFERDFIYEVQYTHASVFTKVSDAVGAIEQLDYSFVVDSVCLEYEDEDGVCLEYEDGGILIYEDAYESGDTAP